METIRLEHLSIGYAGHLVMADIDAAICSGELTCLVGRNGVGKSTLMRTMAGFQKALQGRVMIDGNPIDHLSQAERARRVSVVLTEKPDVQNMTVREIVAMGRSPYTGFFGLLTEEDKVVVADSIHHVGLDALAERKIQTLSDGERQKMMIAKSLAQQTPVMILDEPTAFLDYPAKVEVMGMLRQLAKKMDKTIVLSTHDIELALQQADRFLVMTGSGVHVKFPSEVSLQSLFHDAGNVAAH